MIRVMTGSPGAGKTLRMIWHMDQYRQKWPDRPMYQSGIDDCTYPGVQTLDDPHNWMDCPDGAVIFLDEAQEVFRAKAGGEVPAPLRELERHRHRGIDFILTTQHPAFLHAHLRRLNPTHEHLVALTNNTARVFEWSEINENPQASRDSAGFKVWRYPKALYRYYKSASMHTKKIRLPKWVWKLGLCGIGALVLGWYGLRGVLNPNADASPVASEGKAAVIDPVHMTASQYAMQFIPRVQGKPWSAPAWDGRKVQSDPQLLCIEIHHPTALDCQCYTEQVTHVDVPQATCRRIVEQGNYNPYLKPLDDRNQQRNRQPFNATAQATQPQPAAPPAGIPGPPQGWGADAIHEAYTPPEWVPMPTGGSAAPAPASP